MKKIICLIISTLIIFAALPVFAVDEAEAITLDPIQTESCLMVLLGQFEGDAEEYSFFVKKTDDINYRRLSANKYTSQGRYTLQIDVEPDTQYTYCFAAKVSGEYINGNEITVTSIKESSTSLESTLNKNTKDNSIYIFGETTNRRYLITDPPPGYANAAEADKHMSTVKVPVWKIEDGEKTPSTYSFKINSKLENNIMAVFHELYEREFPILKLKTYKYRLIGGSFMDKGGRIQANGVLSMHSFGTAIDVNPSVNDLYYTLDERDRTSPYYMDADIINVFKRYGWEWGGEWENCIDTMHFQYIFTKPKIQKPNDIKTADDISITDPIPMLY